MIVCPADPLGRIEGRDGIVEGAEKVRVTADGGEVARLVRGRVPAEVALAERRRPFVASQLPPRSPLGSPG